MKFRALIIVLLIGCLYPWNGVKADENKVSFSRIRRQIFDSTVRANSEPVKFIVGDRGIIYRGLLSEANLWTPVDSGVKETLFAVYFPDARHGWISGSDGTIIASTDGGLTWAPQTSHTDKHLFCIHFANARFGCAAGDWGAVVITHDGGKTWENVSLQDDIVIYAVYLLDDDNGLLVGEFGKILSTSDGGRTWQELPPVADQSLFCMTASGPDIVAAGLDGIVLISHDRGHTWGKAVNPSKNSIYGIALKGSIGWAVGDAGVLLHSADGGNTWGPVRTDGKPSLAWDKRGSSLFYLNQGFSASDRHEVFFNEQQR